jgi:hypothetical protein
VALARGGSAWGSREQGRARLVLALYRGAARCTQKAVARTQGLAAAMPWCSEVLRPLAQMGYAAPERADVDRSGLRARPEERNEFCLFSEIICG